MVVVNSTIKMMIYTKLQTYINHLESNKLSEDRKVILKPLVAYIQNKLNVGEQVNLNFICTHNSRRSQFAQVWSATASYYYGVKGVNCFSGGTEVTACNERTVSTLKSVGFEIDGDTSLENPLYSVLLSETEKIELFSKLCTDTKYVKTPFGALMTCSNAEKNCPFIPEAEIRIPVKYEDPKAFDDTPKEREMYGVRCKQIAEEMFYVFSQLAK